MTFADIKISALKLMNAAPGQNIVAANIATYYSDTNLNDYLYQMNESINRCFDRILNDQVAPQAVVEVDDYTTVTADGFITMDLTQITDLYKLDRVIYSYGSYYVGNHEFLVEGDDLILTDREGDYKLVYTKTMPYFTDSTTDSTALTLPDEILRLIPYFIKGELYTDDVNVAAVAMNTFEQRLLQIKKKKERHQTKVVDVFGGYYD